MRLHRGLAAFAAVMTVAVPAMAQAQTESRIIMRRPLPPSTVASGQTDVPQCGQEGQPACPTDCDFQSASWQVGEWEGASCGDGGTARRSVSCVGIRTSGQSVPMPDSFCLQDESEFSQSCGQSEGGINL